VTAVRVHASHCVVPRQLDVEGEEALPPGAFNVITGTGADAGSPLTRHRGTVSRSLFFVQFCVSIWCFLWVDVAKITFTGSVATGSAIMSACAKDIRKISLELGGKSAMIVFDDLDEEAFARAVEW
jgi:betaine-aldehyde dehydrogenase